MAEQLVPLLHEPIRAPRLGFHGECIFAATWREFMAKQAHYFDSSEPMFNVVLSSLPTEPTQRHASILASVVTWLGTNCGRSVIEEAERHDPPGGLLTDYRYLHAWWHDNHRRIGINEGIRTIEHLLSTGHPSPLPGLSAEDLEVVDHLMCWLGTKHGQIFLRVAKKRVVEAYERDRQSRMEQWAKENGRPHPMSMKVSP